MFEETAPKNSEGKNKKPVREAAELRMPSILYPWSPLGIHACGGGWRFRSRVHARPNSNIQHIKFWGFKEAFRLVQGCRWRSSLQLIVASRVFTEKYRCNLHNLSRKYRLSQLKFGHSRRHHTVWAFLREGASFTLLLLHDHTSLLSGSKQMPLTSGFSAEIFPGVIWVFGPSS